MRPMKKYNLLFALMSMILLTHCGNKTSSLNFKVNDSSNLALTPNEKVAFSQIKSQILTPYCLSCHSSVGTEANLKKWISPGNPDSSLFFTTVENGSMPKNQKPLSTLSLELIRNYITQMAPTTVTPPTGGATTGISYAVIKSAVLTPYRCLNCHSVGSEASLAKWMNKTSPSRSSFYTTIKNGSMPQGGSSVPTNLQAMVLQYITDFANR
jgi:hypothetical protein